MAVLEKLWPERGVHAASARPGQSTLKRAKARAPNGGLPAKKTAALLIKPPWRHISRKEREGGEGKRFFPAVFFASCARQTKLPAF
jgi:hypothetical protein